MVFESDSLGWRLRSLLPILLLEMGLVCQEHLPVLWYFLINLFMKEEMETRFLHVLPKANEEFISHCGLKPKNASYIPLHLAQTFPVSPDSTKLSCSLRQRSVCSVLAYCFLNPHKVLVLSLLYLSTLLNLLNLLPFSLYFSTLTLGRMHTVFS